MVIFEKGYCLNFTDEYAEATTNTISASHHVVLNDLIIHSYHIISFIRH